MQKIASEKIILPPEKVLEIQEEMDRHAVDMITATSRLQMEAQEIRANKPNWKSYLQSQMITNDDYNFITAYESVKKLEEKNFLLDKSKLQSAKTFISLMSNISKDQTVRYVLTIIDDMLLEDRSRCEIFWAYARKQKQSVWEPFILMLTRQDSFVMNQVSRIIAKLACWSQELMDGPDLMYYLNWLKDKIMSPINEYVQTNARCLQMMLRIDEYRHAFMNIEGLSMLVSALGRKANFQLQYQLIFCIWCLTFNSSIAEKMPRYGVIPTLSDILTESPKEKVIRIILATFRNMLEKPEDKEIIRESGLQMVQCKVLKTLELMDNKKYDDAEFQEDIEFVSGILQNSVLDLSSFDEYVTEVKSGRLQWNPVHKSEKFWKENILRFNEKNFELLKILIRLMDIATDPLILCVAAHDVGEYVRHYPRGKTIIEQLNGKQLVMRLLTHEDPNVRYHALLSVQKIMVHNWEYLGRQLEMETEPPESKPKTAALVK